MVMVKPALSYLDIIREVKNHTNLPVTAYNVSGEYAMIKAAAERGWIDGDAVALEHVGAIKRAGADLVLTYLAGHLAEGLNGRTGPPRRSLPTGPPAHPGAPLPPRAGPPLRLVRRVRVGDAVTQGVLDGRSGRGGVNAWRRGHGAVREALSDAPHVSRTG